jgi:NDP-sugar pyrophosphorylase family protein
MLRFHRRSNARATIAVTRSHAGNRFGIVSIAASGEITQFREKRPSCENTLNSGKDHWINAGVYLMEHEVIAGIPAGGSVSLEREVFPSMVGTNLYGFQTESYFIDIGIPEDYERARFELPRRCTYAYPG